MDSSLDKQMVGVILAAGKGARMYPFSERSPKPILPILNRPLLAHQIEVMRDCGITEVHIVVGHLGYQVASAFGDGSNYGVHIHFVEQESTLGLAHAVGALESRIQLPFLLMLGDIYFHLKAPLRPLCEQVLSGEVNANLVSMYEPDPEMVRRNFVIEANELGRVHRVIEKPRYVDSQLKGCGLYVFDPHIFDAIRRTPRTAMRDEYEITDSIQILINDGYVTHHHPIVERDLNLTKPADLLVINLIELARNGLTKLVDDSVQLPPGTAIDRSVIGKGAVITHPIRISNSVIMPGVVVSASTDLDSVVMDGEHTVYCPGVAAQALAQAPTPTAARSASVDKRA
jgi:glucose-1-phosphate thymidylyltransferase